MAETRTLWTEMRKMYEEKAQDIVMDVLNSERFLKAVQVVLTTSEEFRKVVTKGVELAMSNLELPTGQDFLRLYQRMDQFDDLLFDIRASIHDLSTARHQKLERTLERILTRLDALEGRATPAPEADNPTPAARRPVGRPRKTPV